MNPGEMDYWVLKYAHEAIGGAVKQTFYPSSRLFSQGSVFLFIKKSPTPKV